MNSLIQSAALLPVEQTINHLLATDPHSVRQLANFAGKIIQIECLAPRITTYVTVTKHGLRLSPVCEQPVDARISARSSALLRALSVKPQESRLANDELQISGDAVLVQDVHRLLTGFKFNWQDPLALLIGDAATWQVESGLENAATWGRSSLQAVGRNLDEYLHDEAGIVPPRKAVESFGRRMDALRLRIDRLGARLELARTRLADQ